MPESPAANIENSVLSEASAAAGTLHQTQQQLAERQKQHPWLGLRSLVHAADRGRQPAATQVLRIRSSFKKAVTAEVLQCSDARHDGGRLATDDSTGVVPVHGDMFVSSNGRRSMHQHSPTMMHQTSRVVPESAVRSDYDGKPTGQYAGSMHKKQQQQRGVHSSPGKTARSSKRGSHCSNVAMHKALHQSIVQVRGCTLQLIEQRQEQQSMQKVLQAMNAQIVAIIDRAVSAAVQQPFQ